MTRVCLAGGVVALAGALVLGWVLVPGDAPAEQAVAGRSTAEGLQLQDGAPTTGESTTGESTAGASTAGAPTAGASTAVRGAQSGEPRAGLGTEGPAQSSQPGDAALGAILERPRVPEVLRRAHRALRRVQAGEGIGADERRAVADFQGLVADLLEAAGVERLEDLAGDPRVQEAFVPAWLESLGLELSPEQREAVRALARDRAEGLPAVAPRQPLARLAVRLRGQQALEHGLTRVLEPAQRASYREAVGPALLALERDLGDAHVRGRSEAELQRGVVQLWAQQFGLEPEHAPLAEEIAGGLIRDVLSLPPLARVGEPDRDRQLKGERALSLLELQLAAERALAERLPPSGAQARAVQGSHMLLRLELHS